MEGWDLIFSYTRKQAIEDGVLIEVPKAVQEMAGFKYPMVITTGVYELINGEVDKIGLIVVALWLEIIKSKSKKDTIYFSYKNKKLYAKCHPDDDGITPVITIMLITED